eukprot:7218758-Lingulodinium_polyedra.AAC.1
MAPVPDLGHPRTPSLLGTPGLRPVTLRNRRTTCVQGRARCRALSFVFATHRQRKHRRRSTMAAPLVGT